MIPINKYPFLSKILLISKLISYINKYIWSTILRPLFNTFKSDAVTQFICTFYSLSDNPIALNPLTQIVEHRPVSAHYTKYLLIFLQFYEYYGSFCYPLLLMNSCSNVPSCIVKLQIYQFLIFFIFCTDNITISVCFQVWFLTESYKTCIY